jgi:hypothetical protein
VRRADRLDRQRRCQAPAGGGSLRRVDIAAAKSIIRFSEINAQKARENGTIGIDEVTEYFLVGSSASWIVALGGLALAG